MDQSVAIMGGKMIVALAGVLAVFAGAVLVFRKISGSSKGFLGRGANVAKPMEIIAFQSLGPSRSLYLVRCLDRKVLVGATNASIQAIVDFGKEDEDDDSSNAFGSVLKDRVSSGSDSESLKSKLTETFRDISRV